MSSSDFDFSEVQNKAKQPLSVEHRLNLELTTLDVKTSLLHDWRLYLATQKNLSPNAEMSKTQKLNSLT